MHVSGCPCNGFGGEYAKCECEHWRQVHAMNAHTSALEAHARRLAENDDKDARIAELEAQVKALTEAVKKLGRVAAWMKLNMADPRVASLCLLRHVDGVEKLVPLAESLNTDWIDAMNNPIARAAVEGGKES